ncbi:MAG: YbaB/EbfC family nucleoid-associated protein [Planctomycetes bacterium]|nr:YbaB/EbfC family nucleoid-associated protein [Planctomycetota bacterium]
MAGMGGFDIGAIAKQAQAMQRQIAKVQEGLRDRVVDGEAGGGMVKAFVNGQQELISVTIEKEVVNPQEIDMLQDLIVAAVTVAMKKAKELSEKEMQKVTGGLSLPGLI